MRYFLIAIIFLVPFTGIGQQWKNFTDTARKFTAKYPPSWVNKIKENNRVFFTSPSSGDSDNFLENINISVTTNPSFGTELKIADLVPSVVNTLKEQFGEFSEISRRFFKWNNIDAAELIYTATTKTEDSMKVRSIQWYCFYRSRMYIATFVSDAATITHDQTAKKIMSSIVFK